VAAEAARRRPERVAGVVASPTVDPRVHTMPRVLRSWWLDRKREPTRLDEVHAPERRRVGFRRLFHMLRVHLDHALEELVAKLTAPILVIRGRDDVISRPEWGRRLAGWPPRVATSRCRDHTASAGAIRMRGRGTDPRFSPAGRPTRSGRRRDRRG
jgi:pimeloyl-ACP methyl ester carboxylesterase